jgi:methylenetetrahydrofolate reductase (NADPH)
LQFPETRLLNTFRDALGKQNFTLTAQLQLTHQTDRASVLGQADLLGQVADAVQITCNPGGHVHMATLSAASLLLQNGVDPVVHMNCRDRNNIALQSDLIGAQALGVTSLLLEKGDQLANDYQPKTQSVFEFGGKKLLSLAKTIGGSGNNSQFNIGAIITVFNCKPDWQAKSLVAKSDAGANFLQTQLCFDADLLRQYVRRLVEIKLTRRALIMVSVATLPSAETARWVRDNVRGSVMPESVIQRLDQASDPVQEGIEVCAELLQLIKEIPGVGGANVLTPGDIATIPAAIRAAGVQR